MDNSGDWRCSCGENNFRRRDNCRKCDKPRTVAENTSWNQNILNYLKTSIKPTIIKRVGDWNCTCGELNFSNRNKCRKCNKDKNLHKIEMKDGDWKCLKDNCNEHNFKFRDICRKCNALKHDSNKTKAEDKTVDEIGEETNICVVCLDQSITHAIVKCGHLCYCGVCGFNIKKCPICREDYNPDTDLLKIFNI